jgi:hypothetical protein
MKELDLSKPVKLISPQVGEEVVIYKVVNFNEETKRCYIASINLSVNSQELVSINDIVNL